MSTLAQATPPLVAIIGRANVGKSTLFNSLTRSSQALVDDVPGVTRDRLLARVTWEDHTFLLVDTGGLTGGEDELGQLVRRQAEAAVAEADLLLLVMDGRAGPQPGDDEVVEYLRTTGKPLLLVVNKIDHPGREENLADFYRFGLSPLYPVSATHKLGLVHLLEDLVKSLPPPQEVPLPSPALRVAVLGRPNVGKSSFINRVLGEERLIVSDRPGTTRDAVDTPLTWEGRDYLLIDTAGVRRPSRVLPGLEKYMVLKALKALERCDVALLLLEAPAGVTQQDLRLASLIKDEAKGCLIAVNKWDLVPKEAQARQRVLDQVTGGLEFLGYAPILPLSVKTGYNLSRVFPLIDTIQAQSGRRAGTGELNQLIKEITGRVRPPLFHYRPVKFYYLTQPEVHPPTFVAFVNHPEGVPDSYRRYLVKQLRAHLDIPHAPLRLFLKKRQRQRRGAAKARGQ
ncbi:MAG: ribosome biogenesis GTPase Der [Thermodesulfobacteriota bacterium]